LSLDEPGATATKTQLKVSAATPAELFDAYLKAGATLFASQRWHAGSAPLLAGESLLPLGHALLALDKPHPADAASELAKLAPAPEGSALVQAAQLDAEEADHQDLPAQNTREAIIKRFAGASRPLERELYARALAGDDQVEPAVQALGTATQAYPHDTSLALLDVETLAANGRGEQSMDLLKRLVRSDDQDARAWFLLGRAAIQQGQPRIAIDDYLLRALVLYTRGSNAAAEAETRNALGVGYDRLGQPDAAIEQYQRAAVMREKLGDQVGLSRTLRNLAVVQSVSGHRDEAEKTLDRAKVILEGIGDRANLADLHNDRGVIAEERGDFEAALAAYRQALAIRQQLDIPNLVAESLNNVGFSSFQLGKFDDALVYWQQARAIYEKLDDRGRMLKVEQSMGMLDVARGHFSAAATRLQASTQTAEDAQLSEQASVGHVYLADLALTEGRYRDAQSQAKRALEIATRRSDQRAEVEARLQLVRSALALGVLGEADAGLLAMPAAESLGSEQRAALQLAMAVRARVAGDRKAAQTRLDESAAAAAEAHSGALDMQIRFERTRLALASGDIARANMLVTALGNETNRLNEVPVRLQWLELAMATELRDGDRKQALAHYRQTLALLKDAGNYAYATTLHELGARALHDGAEADAARSAAKTSRERLVADAPADAGTSLTEQLDRRLQEEAATNAR
jgi:tetratricopeptide (TPR) repeat protein